METAKRVALGIFATAALAMTISFFLFPASAGGGF